MDGGRTWKRLAAQQLPPSVVGLAASAKGTVFALTARNGLWQSTNGGRSFSAITTPERQLFTATVAADGALWVAGKTGVWRRQNTAWARVAAEAALLLAVNPNRPTQAVWVDDQGAVHRTEGRP